MNISIKQVAPDVFALTFDDTTVAVDERDLKTLLIRVTRFLLPDGDKPQTPVHVPKPQTETYRELLDRLRRGNDIGLQALILAVGHDDMLALLKFGERETAFMQRLFGNMSDRSATMFEEDLPVKFKDGLPETVLEAAMKRIIAEVHRLEDEGVLLYRPI